MDPYYKKARMSNTLTQPAQPARLSFGPFTIDVARRVVSREGTPLRLTVKCVELLIALARRPGQTVSKEQLLQAAWHDPEASDATLAQHIFLLRRALNDAGRTWIRTVPNAGYRFVGHIMAEGSQEPATAERLLAGAATFRSLMTRQGLVSAIELYGRVIGMDETRADAYAGRAACSRLLAQHMYADPVLALSAAKRDALEAVKRDAENADALIEAAYAYALFERNPHAAAAHALRAAKLQPEHPELRRLQVSLQLMRGDVEGALAAVHDRPDPLRGALLYLMREYEAAMDIFSGRLDDSLVRLLYGACRLFEGDVEGARADFTSVYREEIDLRHAPQPNVRHFALAFLIFASARAGDVNAARRGILDLARLSRERYVSPMARAIAHAGLNERDAAVAFVEEAVARLDPWAAHIAVDPFLDTLREDARFMRLQQLVAGARAA